ncbi:MAG TPA: amidohydrolase family protein [Kineosporiaceae bacterium]
MIGPVVDAHHHVWDLAVRDQEWITGSAMAPIRRSFDLAQLRPQAEAAGVVATVVVATQAVSDETPELLALADTDPLVAGVVGWVDLTAPSVADDLARLREAPGGRWLRGVRHLVQAEPDPEWLCRPDVVRGLRAVAAAGLVYDLLTVPHQLPAAIRAAREVPGGRFVLDHCSKPPAAAGRLEPWATDLRTLAAEPNVTCKLSGLVTEADWARWTVTDLVPYADVVLDAFGAGRVMFGSDWPVCLLAAGYAQVVDVARQLLAGASDTERHQVLAGTATAVYGPFAAG